MKEKGFILNISLFFVDFVEISFYTLNMKANKGNKMLYTYHLKYDIGLEVAERFFQLELINGLESEFIDIYVGF